MHLHISTPTDAHICRMALSYVTHFILLCHAVYVILSEAYFILYRGNCILFIPHPLYSILHPSSFIPFTLSSIHHPHPHPPSSYPAALDVKVLDLIEDPKEMFVHREDFLDLHLKIQVQACRHSHTHTHMYINRCTIRQYTNVQIKQHASLQRVCTVHTRILTYTRTRTRISEHARVPIRRCVWT